MDPPRPVLTDHTHPHTRAIRTRAGPLPCYEPIEEHELLDQLYSFQRQRQQQLEREKQRNQPGQKVMEWRGSFLRVSVFWAWWARARVCVRLCACVPFPPPPKINRSHTPHSQTPCQKQGPGLNLVAASRAMMAPSAGSGRTIRLLGGGLFDLDKGRAGANALSDKSGNNGEGEPMLGVTSPFVRLRDGRIVPLRTLNEEQGDFVCLTHFPAPHEEDNPNLRFNRVLPYLKSLMPTFLTTFRCVLWECVYIYVCVCAVGRDDESGGGRGWSGRSDLNMTSPAQPSTLPVLPHPPHPPPGGRCGRR